MHKALFALLGAFALSLFTISRSEPQLMNLYKFNDSNSDPNAVCNDGTRGGYYFAKALDSSQSNVFVVHLPGGGQCYDKESCDGRAKNMKSFNFTTSTISVTGYLDASPNNTPLWGANKAYLVYCSSDGYMGDAPASDATWGYHFRGQRLVHSLFQALSLNHGFNESTMVYLTGSSAGARGVMTHIDQLVADWIPPAASVVGLLDSPYYLDVEPYSSASKGFQYQEQQKYKYYNTHAVLSADCIAAYPTPSDQWKCQFGEHRMPFVKTPYFLIFDQFDSYQLDELTRSSASEYTPETSAYAVDFATYGRTSMQNLSLSVATAPPPLPPAHPHSGGVSMERHSFVRSGFFPPPKASSAGVAVKVVESPADEPSTPIGADSIKPAAPALSNPGYGYYSTACYYHAVGSSSLFYTTATNDKTILRDAFETYLSHFPASHKHSEHPNKEFIGAAPHHRVLKHDREDHDGGHPREGGHRGGKGWSLSWIDNCTDVNCGLYCNGIV